MPTSPGQKSSGSPIPLLSDIRRHASRAFGVLYDDPAMANDPKKMPIYLRSQRAWFVIDTAGVVRFARVNTPRELLPNDEILQVLQGLR